jgi:alkylation response protein AidB-like acyl-CoA dehydrogenase
MPTDTEIVERTERLVAEAHDVLGDQFTFRGLQYDAGLAMVHFPEGFGGLGGNRGQQAVVDTVLRTHGVTYEDLRVNPIGIGMGAPTLLAYGTDELKARHLRRIFTGEDIWCQLFSEPSHGSDVAGIPSRAVRDGDEWVVNGQKVWTTLAHVSRFGMLLTRTNPEVPKHKGLTYFVLDMQAPGVDVRPLYQMTGEAEFNEVFLTDVRVPDTNRLGADGEGWRVALTTLMNERVALAGGPAPRGSGPIAELVRVWAERRDALDPAARDAWRERVARLWQDAEVVRLTNYRAKLSAVGGNPGPEGSVAKLAAAELNKRIQEAVIDLQGPAGMLHEPGYPKTRSSASMATRSGRFLRSRANTIEGGTSEIMRNILGERMLGLPGDIRVDTDIPWSHIPR